MQTKFVSSDPGRVMTLVHFYSLGMRGYISYAHKTKSVIITENGLERARRFKKMLFDEIGKMYGSV